MSTCAHPADEPLAQDPDDGAEPDQRRGLQVAIGEKQSRRILRGRLAIDESIEDAVRWAKKLHHKLLSNAVDVGGEMYVLI